MKPVDSRLISVVIQGPVCRTEKQDLLKSCIASIRRHLVEAEIVVSTWQDQDVSGLPPEIKLVQSSDPQPLVDIANIPNNVNRQLKSTLLGVQAATRPYVLKFRADHALSGDAIAQLATERPVGCLFSQPITITNFFVRNPVVVPFLFHISDVVMFGKREDLLDFWDRPLVTADEVVMPQPHSRMLGNFRGYTRMRHVPEQSLLLGWLKKKGIDVCLPYCFYTSFSLLALWEKTLLENFHMIAYDQSGVIFPKRFMRSPYGIHTLYQPKDLAALGKILGTSRYRLRYLRLVLNQYVFCWFRVIYWLSIINVFLSIRSQGLMKKLREYYRRFKLRNLN